MTFFGQEQPVEYGPESLFDPAMAQMVLNTRNNYINALYQDYLRGAEELKQFNEKYGDFISPINSDMDWYNKNFGGKIRDAVNKMYANGDLLRTQEGRSAIYSLINSLPYGEYARRKEAAKKAERYIESRDALQKAGMWNEDYERAQLGGQLLEEWNGELGPWTATSASPYMDYEQKYGHLFDKMDYEYDPEESKKFPGMYVMTKNKSRMHDILSASRPDLSNDPQYKYDLQRIKNANPDIDDATARNLLENEIVERNYKGGIKIEQNPFALDDYRTRNDIKAARAKAQIDFEYDKKRLQDPVFLSAAKGGKKDETEYNIFRRAEALTPAQSAAHFGYGTNSGGSVGYVPSGGYNELIDPVIPAAYTLAKDSESGQIVETYVFNTPSIMNNIYTIDDDGKVKKQSFTNEGNAKSFRFIPEGQIRAARAGSGYRYYISGTIAPAGSNTVYDPNTGSQQVWIEVKERDHVYDGK